MILPGRFALFAVSLQPTLLQPSRFSKTVLLPTCSLFFFSLFFRGMSSIKYPETRHENLVEVLHGVNVPDPFRSLEDPKSAETLVFHLIHPS